MKSETKHFLTGFMVATIAASAVGYFHHRHSAQQHSQGVHMLMDGWHASTLYSVAKRTGDDADAQKLKKSLKTGGLMSFLYYDKLLEEAQVNRLPKPHTEAQLSSIDTSERDALLISVLDSNLNDVDLEAILGTATTRARFDDDYHAGYLSDFFDYNQQKPSPRMALSIKAGVKTSLNKQQKQRLQACYDKLKGLRNSVWHTLFDADSHGACKAEFTTEAKAAQG
jgi:hypothetical protein